LNHSHSFSGCPKEHSDGISGAPTHTRRLNGTMGRAFNIAHTPPHALTYAQVMQLKYKKLLSVTIWMVMIAILAMTAQPTSPTSRILVVALGLVPAFLILRFWNGPAKSMSERIQEGRG
jgi:hypothetical protein